MKRAPGWPSSDLLAERVPRHPQGPIWLLLLALAAVNCTRTTETRSESAFQAAQQEETKKAETITETVQTGPSTTTVYRFAPPEENWRPAPVANRTSAPLGVPNRQPEGSGDAIQKVGATGPYGAIDSLPPHGPLVEMTVTQTGPILDTKRQTDKEASNSTQTVRAETKTATVIKTSYWPPAWFLGCLALVLVGVAALAYGVVKGWLRMPFGL